jgi:hypothetical protein
MCVCVGGRVEDLTSGLGVDTWVFVDFSRERGKRFLRGFHLRRNVGSSRTLAVPKPGEN